MTANYEKEQRELIQAVAETERQLANAEQDNIDLRASLSIIRKCTDLKELTPELVNRLITKIEVFDSTKDENGKKHVPIKVHFIGVCVIVIPDGKTILETYEEIRKNPPSAANPRISAEMASIPRLPRTSAGRRRISRAVPVVCFDRSALQ